MLCTYTSRPEGYEAEKAASYSGSQTKASPPKSNTMLYVYVTPEGRTPDGWRSTCRRSVLSSHQYPGTAPKSAAGRTSCNTLSDGLSCMHVSGVSAVERVHNTSCALHTPPQLLARVAGVEGAKVGPNVAAQGERLRQGHRSADVSSVHSRRQQLCNAQMRADPGERTWPNPRPAAHPTHTWNQPGARPRSTISCTC